MRRAMQTAQHLSVPLGCQPVLWLDIHEVGGIYHSNQTEHSAESFRGMGRNAMSKEFHVQLPGELS